MLPIPNMQQLKGPQPLQTGSATGNPRNKVALAPGHSLMDWIRLGNSGKDLTGVGGVLQDVTPDQLAKHNTTDDAWIAIRGNVYNVTQYMNFHPGGQDELMRGVGTDATKLFSEVHAWVNYDSMLRKCHVGRFQARGNDNVVRNGEGGLQQFLASKEEKAKHALQSTRKPMRWDWYELEDRGSLVLYCSGPGAAIRARLGDDDKDLTIHVRLGNRIHHLHFALEKEASWPLRIIQIPDGSKAEIQICKAEAGIWKRLGSSCPDSDTETTDSPPDYSPMLVTHSAEINHNTRLLALVHTDRIISTVPVGHHVRVRMLREGEEVIRCYTPVRPLVDWPDGWDQSPASLILMVKGYAETSLSSWLSNRPVGSLVDVSGTEGNFDIALLNAKKKFYCIAAGTGVTPMINLIHWARNRPAGKCKNISLLFFNRTERDILWRDQLNKLADLDKRFSVKFILSEAEDSWSGERGHMDGDVLRSFLPQQSPQLDPECFVCICGPTPFTHLTRGLLHVMDYTDQTDYHCFVG